MALRDNLISWWSLDETSGTRADSHGSNSLTDNNTVSYAGGKKSNAADFEATNTEYLSITDASQSGLDQTGDQSWSLWVNFETISGAGNFRVMTSKYEGVGGKRSFMLGLDDSATKKIRFWLWNSAEANEILAVNWSPSASTWYHVVCTWDASASTAEFFINGSSIGTATGALTDIQNGTAAFEIGSWSGGGANYLYDGLIDEVGVWSKILSGTEITALYNSGSGLDYAGTAPAASGPANLKSYNTNLKANIKSINTNLIANIKSLNTNI
jgi:hypothetical protein